MLKNTILGLLMFCMACAEKPEAQETKTEEGAYSIIEEGIFVEKFAPEVTDENRYNLDNAIFKVGRTFIYDYVYQDKDGKEFYFEGGRDGWNFAPVGTDRYYVVKQVHIKVLNGLQPMIEQIPDYNQTLLNFTCPPNTDYTISGVVENYKNVWMHPPREALFSILELNPFPFVQARVTETDGTEEVPNPPYEVGHSWEWELDIESKWGDPRWITWEGALKNKYTYKISAKEIVSTAFGDLECLIIDSTAKNSRGQSSLKASFDPNYGFVKLDYTNIDGSKIIMTLSELLTEQSEDS